MPRPYFHDKSSHIDEILRVDHAGEYGAIRIYEGQLAIPKLAVQKEFFMELASSPIKYRLRALANQIPSAQFNLGIAVNPLIENLIKEMLSQEEKHLEYFEKEIVKHGARPTILLPIWNGLGFAMGYLSALCGVKVAMLCTEAVEEVIDEHYQKQYKLSITMGSADLAKNIEQHRQDELHHKNTAIEYGSTDVIFYPYLKMAIGKLCKFAIFASKII